MKHLSALSIFFVLFMCSPSPVIDTKKLALELDSIMETDQKYRLQMNSVMNNFGWSSPEMAALWELQLKIDSSNLSRVIEIIHMTGNYPGNSLVGRSAGETVFFVLQHAPDSIHALYIDMILQAGKENELDKSLVAMFYDRYLMRSGEPQIYGTQVKFDPIMDDLTGETRDSGYVWSIKDTFGIDELREQQGLGTLEEYLNHIGLSRWDQK